MASRDSPRGMRAFLVLWIGQLVSAIGTGLGSFTLGVWVYEKTGSATSFALMAFTAGTTALLLSPLAGSLADRWDRRRLLMLSDLGSALTTLAMAALLFSGRMQPWHIYPVVALMVGFGVFQGPALLASISLLVPKEQLARASGMTQMAQAGAQILGPLTAGILIGRIGYSGVVLIDCATFLVSLATVVRIRFPTPPRHAEEPWRSPLGDLGQGWRYLRGLPGLFALIRLYAMTNLLMGMVQVLLAPLILSFATPLALGTVNSAGAAGILLGGVALSIWGGPRRRVAGVLTALAVQAVILFLGGLQPSVPLIACACFAFMLTLPIASACSQTILQSKVAAGIQGRVFAVAGMVSAGSMPLAALAAGPLADRVFRPLLANGGPLAGTFVGRLLGTGPGRGVGLMLICVGLLVLLIVGLASRNPRLRGLETEIPDAVEPHDVAAEPLAAEGAA